MLALMNKKEKMKKRMFLSSLLTVLFLSVHLFAIGIPETQDPSRYWPTYGWRHSAPEKKGEWFRLTIGLGGARPQKEGKRGVDVCYTD